MKRASLALAVSALVAFLWPGLTMQKNLAAAATSTPAALQYDQIVRMVMPPATPPAPGSFQADYATVTGAPGASETGNDSRAPAAMMEAINAMRKGTLTRYAYYKGWLRTDDVAHQTAVISKCQEHQYITLDLAKKTYTMTNTKPACNTTPQMPMGPHPSQVENEAPGTVDMTVTNSVQNLGLLTIETIATNGYDNTLQMSMTNATGSCSNNSMGMNMEQYVSKIPLPHQYCPLPQGANSSDPSSVVVHGGCKPTMHTSGNAAGIFDADKLVMFSKMTFAPAGAESRMGGFAQVTERGNVKWSSGAEAEALFTIPPGFTKAN